MGTKKKTHDVTPAALISHAEGIERVAWVYREMAKWLENKEIKSLKVELVITEITGLVNMAKFLGAVAEAYSTKMVEGSVREIAGAIAEFDRMVRVEKSRVDAEEEDRRSRDVAIAGTEAASDGLQQRLGIPSGKTKPIAEKKAKRRPGPK